MKEDNAFLTIIKQARKNHEEAGLTLTMLEELMVRNEIEAVYRASFSLVQVCEKLALTARALPAYTGRPGAMIVVEQQMMDVTPASMGYTPEGWFTMSIPFLLPKKRGKEMDYLQGLLYPHFRRFFQGHHPEMISDAVLVFRHVYNKKRPERQWRDHDNLEVKTITDMIALFLMPDDNPTICQHFHCSAAGDEEHTEIYLIPQSKFPECLLFRKLVENGLQ